MLASPLPAWRGEVGLLRDGGKSGAGLLTPCKVIAEIKALAASGHGVLFTTHDPNHALRAADRAFLLREGTRVAEGPVRDVLDREKLEALYRAPVERLVDPETGAVAFLPG